MRALFVAAAVAALSCSFSASGWAQNAQQDRMKSCNSGAAAKKLAGAERKSYMSDCLSARTNDEPRLTAQQQRMKDCNAGASGMKGSARSDYMGSCLRGGSTSSSSSGTASRKTEPRETAGSAPRERSDPSRSTRSGEQNNGSLLERWLGKNRSTTGSANESANTQRQHGNEAQAKMSCGGDTVVWVNLDSRIYHFKDYRNYGTTKQGAYMCERDAVAGGSRAAKNEKRS